MKQLKLYPEFMVLTTLAVITRFWQLFIPSSTVFDEVYFKAFAGHYFDHAYYFDIHPPLGKLLIAGIAALTGQNGASLLDSPAVGLRILPATAGALLIPLVWLILRRLGVSRLFATLGASLVLLDGAFLVESRFILMDSILILFGLGAFYVYLLARRHAGLPRLALLTTASILAGAAASIKWTGLTALALVGAIWLWDARSLHRNLRARAAELAILIAVPFAVYVGTFAVHFALLPNSGDGDAFMSQRFQKTLKNGLNYSSDTHMRFADKFIELNQEMYRANKTLTATHPYSSKWYTWPVLGRSIYYWQGDMQTNGRQGNIYLLGNPLVWWGLLAGAIVGLAALFSSKNPLPQPVRFALAVSAVAYLMNLLPFMAVSRVMFLYHYFFAFVFCLIFVIVLFDYLSRPWQAHPEKRRQLTILVGSIMVVILLSFAYFAPLYYGLPLSAGALEQHMWLKSWR